MKWILIILFAANLVYFGWELDRQTRINLGNSREALIVSTGVKELKLVNELPLPPPARQSQKTIQEELTGETDIVEADEDLTVVAPDTGEPGDQEELFDDLVTELPDIITLGIPASIQPERIMCFSYGPFTSDSQAEELLTWFQENNVELKQRVESEDENQLLWVYLKPQASRDSAIQAIEDLKSKGIKDYRLIETGDLQNAISLGLFSTQAAVNQRLNELRNKGYQPVVIPYRDSKAVYWLDIKLTDQQDILTRMFTEYPARYNSVPVQCSEIAMP